MQYAFDFIRDAPPFRGRPERVFFALMPDADEVDRFDCAVQQFDRLRKTPRQWLRPDLFHVSVRAVGNGPRGWSRRVAGAQLVASTIRAPAFDVIFGHIRTFEPLGSTESRNRPLVLTGESSGLLRLHGALSMAMGHRGEETGLAIVPHLTLAYGGPAVAERQIEPIRWSVKEFALVHSRRRPWRYEVLGRWPLGVTG